MARICKCPFQFLRAVKILKYGILYILAKQNKIIHYFMTLNVCKLWIHKALFIISFGHRPRTKDDLRAYCILLQVREIPYFYVSICLLNL